MSTTELNTNQNKTEQSEHQRNWRRPDFNVSENKDTFEVMVELPGTSRDNIDISLIEDELVVTASQSRSHPDKDWRLIRSELPQGDFQLKLHLNVPVEENKIEASTENGVLNLVLPKAEKAKPRKIKIK